MSACPDPERLAAAASGEDPVARAHAEACRACAALYDEQLAVSDLADRWLAPPLPAAHRRALGDAILAAPVPARRTARPWAIAAVALASAAAAALVIVWSPTSAPETTPAPVAPIARVDHAVLLAPRPAPVVAPPASPSAAVAGIGRARYTARRTGDHLTVALADGEVALVAPPVEPIALATADGQVTLRDGRALVRARRGVIAEVAVFAGSAEIVAPGGRAAIVTGEVWRAPVREAPAIARGVTAFRDGWLAFRAGRWTDAAAAFDRATDPAVREDAAFWAAVAHQRAGDRARARARFAAFLAAFPQSSHRAAAERGASD